MCTLHLYTSTLVYLYRQLNLIVYYLSDSMWISHTIFFGSTPVLMIHTIKISSSFASPSSSSPHSYFRTYPSFLVTPPCLLQIQG